MCVCVCVVYEGVGVSYECVYLRSANQEEMLTSMSDKISQFDESALSKDIQSTVSPLSVSMVTPCV